MKFWLIVMLYDPSGQWIGKVVQPYYTQFACEQAVRTTRGEPKLRALCVSDDHFSGRKQDPGVPMD